MSIAESSVIYPETVLGEGVTVQDHAVIGKSPVLGARSTTDRSPVPPAEIGSDSAILAGAVVFAGVLLGTGVIIGDQACVRERCTIGEETVIGRGTLIENDVSIGARTRVQANAYITAYSVLEDDVFIAPGVVTTNDNFMGRTAERHDLMKGPAIRRGARIGGGAILLPGVEIGPEALVGAGAVVLEDVPARAVVVGNPARRIRDVPDEELLGSD